MADSDAVERALATAREAFVAPAPARARMRAGLQARGALAAPKAAASLAATGVAKSTVGMLVALAMGAGYCLGRLQPGEPSAPLVPAAPAVAAPAVAAPAVAALASDAASSGSALGLASSASASGAGAATPAADGELAHAAWREPAASKRSGAPRARAHAARSAAASSSAKVDRFAEELALLQRAEHALRAGEAELALAFVGELERRYPQSILAEERSAVRLMAECVRGTAGSRGRAELFLSDRSASVYTDRVRRVCEPAAVSALPAAVAPPPAAASQAPSVADGSREPGH